MNPPPHAPFRIAGWTVQPALNRLSGAEGVVTVEPKMMQVLLCLAAAPGTVVTRARLLETVWVGTVVGDEVLSRAISELRRVLGDDARAPHVIETIPRVGYRLIAPVAYGAPGGDRPAAPVLAAVARATDRVPPASPWQTWAAVAALVVLAAVGAWAAGSSVPAAPRIVRVLPLTTYPGFEIDPALSPDGQHAAFIWSGPNDGHLNLYVRHVTGDALLQLTDTPLYEFSPAWSPDGARLAFARALQGIFEVPALGGPARKLADVGPSSWADVAWSPDGAALVYTDRTASQAPYRLVRLDLASLDTTHLTRPPDGFNGDRDPAFSPDGRRLAFARVADEVGEVFVMPATGGTPQPRTDDHAVIDGIDWTSDGRRLVFASDRAGPFALWTVGADAGPVEPLRLDGVDDLRAPTVRGDRMAFIQSTTETNIWRVDVASGAAERIIASARRDESPRFSPDGRRLAFVSSRSGSSEIWMAGPDGSRPVRLTHFGGSARIGPPAWAPDSRSITFAARVGGQTDLYRLDVDRSLPRRLTSDAARESSPAWSADGGWIYFVATRGRDTCLARIAAEGGPAASWAAIEASALQVTHDGTVYLSRADTTGLWRLSAEGAVEHVIDFGVNHRTDWTWTPEGFYVVRHGEGAVTIERLTEGGAGPEVLVSLPPAPYRQGPVVSPDGRYVLLTRLDHSRHDLVLVDGGR